MAQFQPLKVTQIHKTIRDAVVVTLAPLDGGEVDFLPGQYLTFRREFDGAELRRNYSICSGVDDGVLQIGIKKVDGGAFSTWANDSLKVGDQIDAMPPMGTFHAGQDIGAERNYLGFAGGSGITPVLSLMKSLLSEEPSSTFTLVYANRGINSIMFREEIEDLKNLYMGRLTVTHILESDAQEIDLFTGRVDVEKCNLLFKNWIDIGSIDTAFICGPEPMMLGIRDALSAHGLSDAQIKFELFGSDQPGRVARQAQIKEAARDKPPVTARITIDGTERTIEMARDMSILDAAVKNDLGAPFSCKAGVCSTCRATLVEGEVDMIANHALEDYEVERGAILTCQCYPISDTVVIDYDS